MKNWLRKLRCWAFGHWLDHVNIKRQDYELRQRIIAYALCRKCGGGVACCIGFDEYALATMGSCFDAARNAMRDIADKATRAVVRMELPIWLRIRKDKECPPPHSTG